MAKVMFVNDEADLAELARMALEDRGHTVVLTVDAESAPQLARREQPEIVVLDWVLGRMTGEQVIRRLRSDPATSRIPILLASALVDLPDLGRRVGADATLGKPYTSDELHAAVSAVLAPIIEIDVDARAERSGAT